MMRNPGETLFLFVVIAALAGLCFSVIPPGLSSREESVQYVQMKNFALHGSLEIQSPAFGLGFQATDMAGYRGLFEARNGRLYAIPPPTFPWMASLLYPFFGEQVVDFVPLLFVFLSAFVLGLILDRVMQRDFLYWLLLAVFLAGSPVFMQGLLFSGMTLALLLIIFALWLMVDHFGNKPSMAKLFGASILMGISVLVRLECIFIAFSFYLGSMVVLAVQKRMIDMGAILAGCAVGACAFVLHDIILHDRLPGPYLQLFLMFHETSLVRISALAGAFIGSYVLLALSCQARIGSLWKAFLPMLAVSLVFGAVLLTAARITVSHLMALFPAVLFVFYGTPGRLVRLKKGEGIIEAILATSVVISLVLGASILRPEPRIVLSVWVPMIPLVVVFLALERKTIFAARGMYLVLAFFCGVAFVNGVQESKEYILNDKDYKAARIAFLEKHTAVGDAIAFCGAGNMEHAGPLFFGRAFLVSQGPEDHERFARRLSDRGIDRMYVWTANPLGVKGFNPYEGEAHPAFPRASGTKPDYGGSSKERGYRLVRIETGALSSTGAGRGGS